jgi:hypothetical protein
MIDIANLANGRETVLVNSTNFAGRHFHQRISGFQCSKRRLLPGTARDLAATARSQFDVMNIRAQRNGAKRQRIPQIRRNIIPSINGRSNLKSIWREDVTQFAIGVFDESNARRAIRVVFNPNHFRRDTVLTAFKIDFAILVFVTAADMSRCQPTTVVATAAPFLRLKKTLFGAPLGNFIERRQRLETLRRR